MDVSTEGVITTSVTGAWPKLTTESVTVTGCEYFALVVIVLFATKRNFDASGTFPDATAENLH
jgi:hypothetical protein